MNTTNSNDKKDEGSEGNKISYLIEKLPVLGELFNIHGKIGEGTFSSVFAATLKSSQTQQKFALKHLVPTCHPERIERELQCLQDIGGTDHVVGLDLCLRSMDCIVFVMPYMKHDKFSDYVHDMSVDETRCYMKALLTALQRVHKFNTIHRDVKPSNFLYDRANKRFLLVDFGLAQHYAAENKTEIQSQPLITESQSGKRKRTDENKTSKINSLRTENPTCVCFGKPRICSICLFKPAQSAPRAGTPGFRAPEVLLKYPAQTPGIDVWASGVIMLCILSGTHPFFRSPDDCTALAEITSLFGSVRMHKCASKLGKRITFSENIPGIDIVSLCQKLRKRNNIAKESHLSSNNDEEQFDSTYPVAAYDLLTRLLEPDHTARISAADAITHPFFQS